MGFLLQGANVVWFVLDFGYIFTLGVVRYGWKQLTVPQLQKRAVFAPICFAIAAFAAVATWFLHHQGLDNEVGGRSAYLIQLTISFLYVPLMLRQPDLRNFSYAAAWCRSLGSASVVVFFALHYPSDWFLLTIGCTSAVVDGTFLTIFTRRRWALAAREAPARPAALGPLAGPVPSTLP
jgi:tryptophan-rich sensory protein